MQSDNAVTMPTNPPKGALYWIVVVLSVAIPAIVFVLTRVKYELIASPQVYILPKINAILNAVCALLLVGALVAVKRQQYGLHAKMIYAAMFVSLLFLIGYIIYHISTDPTAYGGEGIGKTVYYVLLASHIILAGMQTPFVLFAFLYGVSGQQARHRRWVKFAFPIWMYVSITGVVCYWMLSPYYPV